MYQQILRLVLSFVSFLSLLTLSCQTSTGPGRLEQCDVFVSGEDGYHTYRIPALIVTKKGIVLAFCEGRRVSRGDAGDIDLLLKRSGDGGKTWSAQTVLWDDDKNTCGNPCPVIDESTGTLWLLLTWNRGDDEESQIIRKESQDTRRVFVTFSKDDGLSWAKPVDITSSVKDPSWGWYATGPGIGIQIKHGSHARRLIIPCDHSYDDPKGQVKAGPYNYGSHIIYSDDHGATWKLGGAIRPLVNECQVVEKADGEGTLLMNMRSYFGRNLRTHSISRDGGLSWSEPVNVSELIEPVCQASIIRYSWPAEGKKGILLFSNPASAKREHMTIKASYDEGRTWPVARQLAEGPSAYSCLTILPDSSLACLFETGEQSAYERIKFARFSIDWLRNQSF